ncbi:hypothetical protein KIW84_055762, partial [Lathyrus oleraceus]
SISPIPNTQKNSLHIHNFSLFSSLNFSVKFPSFTMASSAAAMKFFTFFFIVVFAAVASAQDLSPSLAPAPGPDAGAAGAVTNSVAMIGASIVLSMIAIFKH